MYLFYLDFSFIELVSLYRGGNQMMNSRSLQFHFARLLSDRYRGGNVKNIAAPRLVLVVLLFLGLTVAMTSDQMQCFYHSY